MLIKQQNLKSSKFTKLKVELGNLMFFNGFHGSSWSNTLTEGSNFYSFKSCMENFLRSEKRLL